MNICRYVDVSTVDVETSKLINGRIKATGALFLEASYFLVFFPPKICMIDIYNFMLSVLIKF